MKRILFLLVFICLDKALHAQYIYTIKANRVKITNSFESTELIIENHAQTGTYNITVNVRAGGAIGGVTSKTANTNYGLLEVYSTCSLWFV